MSEYENNIDYWKPAEVGYWDSPVNRQAIAFSREGVKLVGVDQPYGKIISHTEGALVIKVKGHSYWSGRGMTSYAPAEFQVYDMTEAKYVGPSIHGLLWRGAKHVASWDVRSKYEHVATFLGTKEQTYKEAPNTCQCCIAAEEDRIEKLEENLGHGG